MREIGENERRKAWWTNQKHTPGAHVYLLTGPEYVGKFDFARMCAQDLLESETKGHPDFLAIDPFAHEERMEVGELRDMLLSVQTPPQKANLRAVIIENIDQLSAQGQNALLKSIEEPRVPTAYFLTARSEQSVLETVRSRAAAFAVQFVPHEEWSEKARAHFENQTEIMRHYLEGRPELVDQMMKGKRESAKIEKAVKEIEELLRGSFGESLALSRTLAKKHDHKALGVLLDDALLVAHRMGLSTRMQQALATARAQVRKHLNKTFILDQIIFTNYEYK